jgi:hypothetical protein
MDSSKSVPTAVQKALSVGFFEIVIEKAV